jgi:hypothetical protein
MRFIISQIAIDFYRKCGKKSSRTRGAHRSMQRGSGPPAGRRARWASRDRLEGTGCLACRPRWSSAASDLSAIAPRRGSSAPKSTSNQRRHLRREDSQKERLSQFDSLILRKPRWTPPPSPEPPPPNNFGESKRYRVLSRHDPVWQGCCIAAFRISGKRRAGSLPWRIRSTCNHNLERTFGADGNAPWRPKRYS